MVNFLKDLQTRFRLWRDEYRGEVDWRTFLRPGFLLVLASMMHLLSLGHQPGEYGRAAYDVYAFVSNVFLAIVVIDAAIAVLRARDRHVIVAQAGRLFMIGLWIWLGYGFVTVLDLALPDLIELLLRRTDLAISYGAGLLVLAFMIRASHLFHWPRAGELEAVGGLFGSFSGDIRRRYAADIQTSAVHEAGHALLLACNPGVLVMSVRVPHHVTAASRRGGIVSYQYTTPDVWSQRQLYWTLLVHLAGMAAEHHGYGDGRAGGDTDLQQWMTAAREYLRAGLGGAYVALPVSMEDHAINHRALNALKSEQEEALAEFFALNDDVLRDLAGRIAEGKPLEHADLLPYLQRVAFTDDVVRLEGW